MKVVQGATQELRDKAWSLQVHEIHKGRCIICQSSWNAGAHHAVGRKHLETRHVIENGIVLCGKHHSWIHSLTFTEMFLAHAIILGLPTLRTLFERARLESPDLTIEQEALLL